MEAPFVRVLCGPEGSVPGDPCHQGWLPYVVAVFRLTVWILPLASDRGAAPVALRLSCLLLWEAFILPGEVMSSCAALDSEGHALPPLQSAL